MNREEEEEEEEEEESKETIKIYRYSMIKR